MRYVMPVLFMLFLGGATIYIKDRRTAQAQTSQEAAPTSLGTAAPLGTLQSPPSLSAAQIDTILSGYGSPARGSGADFYDLGVAYGIDPAYALAFFVEESSAGTDPRWDGIKPDGSTTHDIGNISCGGGFACYGRWRDYATWHDGIEDWYRLISDEYINGRGFSTVDQVIPVYAPSFENDVGGYTNTVSALVAQWRNDYPVAQLAPAPAEHKSNVTPTMEVGARFDTRDCGSWGFQVGCQHWGTDLLGAEGTPVLAPFDMTIIALGEYPPGPTQGQYVQGTLPDGDVLYLGHLEGRQPMSVGDTLPAGTLLGFTNSLAHTHAQLAPPGDVGPCAQDGSCIDFERYFAEH